MIRHRWLEYFSIVLTSFIESCHKIPFYRPVTERSTEDDNSDGRHGSQTDLDNQNNGAGGSENTGNGQEYGNLLPYLEYREEDRSCPEGWVMDIYGYCRYKECKIDSIKR